MTINNNSNDNWKAVLWSIIGQLDASYHQSSDADWAMPVKF